MESLPVELAVAPDLASRFGLDRDDVAGLAAVVLLGGALSWLCATRPAELPPWAPWDFSWVEFLSAALGLWWYARGVLRTAAHQRQPLWRQACFVLGVAAMYGVVQTHYSYLALHEFFLNRIQHIFMHHLGPFLVALSWPGEMLYRGVPAPLRRIAESHRLRQVLRIVQQPVLAGVLFVGLIYFFLIPAVQFRAMLDWRLYAVMNWSMMGDGLLFWFLVLDPRPKEAAGVSYVTRMMLPFAVMFPQIALGAYIAFSSGGMYRYYELCGRLFPSISTATDQHIGGIVAWIPGAMMSSISFLIVLNHLRLYEESLPSEEFDDDDGSPTRIVVYASSWTGR
jgi:putative membrane protein